MRKLSLALVTFGICFTLVWACSDDSDKRKPPKGQPPNLQCGSTGAGVLDGLGDNTPNFRDFGAIAFHHLEVIPPGTTAVTIFLQSTWGDADLHLGVPGSAPGSRDPQEYAFSSQEASPVMEDWIRISLTGLESPSSSITTTTLQDYQTTGGVIPFAIWGVEADTSYEVEIQCVSVLDVTCGTTFTGSLPGSGQAPPDFAAGTEVQFFHVPTLPSSPGTVSILATSISGDVNLHLGRPGLDRESGDAGDYIFSSAASTVSTVNDLIVVDETGLHDVFGATNPTVTLQDYVSAGQGIWFALAGLDTSNDYRLRVSCSDVEPVGCGDSQNGSVIGSGLSTPDLQNAQETRFFQFDPLPPTAESVTITLDSTSGDADIHLAAPGTAPGSTDIADYIFASTERSPATQDQVVIDLTGLQDAVGGTSTAATITDYLQAGTPMGFVLSGYAALTDFDVSVSCVAPPQVYAIDCGGSFSSIVAGSGLPSPDLTDLSENFWFELVSIPPGTNQVDIGLVMQSGDADLYLAAPGTAPGSQSIADYPITSTTMAGDFIVLCDSGVLTDSMSADTPTLSDYVAAAENLSFVVAGYETSSAFTVSVTCHSGPTQLPATPINCGDTVNDTVLGSGQVPPDFTNTQEVHFYEIPTFPPGGQAVEITLGHNFGEDADLYLAKPGASPGSTCAADYNIASTFFFSDFVVISGCGVSSWFIDYPSPTLADYEAVGSITFAIVGSAPSTDYTLDVTCGAINPPRATDCGGTATGTLFRGFSLADPNVAHIYEIPLASVQGATSIRIEIDTFGDRAFLHLADPDVTPGSLCLREYPFTSYSQTGVEWIVIDATGLSAADGSTAPSPTIADYQAAATNLSFAVRGREWGGMDYDLTITCN